ncbi:MAG: protein YgfX [Sulfuriferula sp.]
MGRVIGTHQWLNVPLQQSKLLLRLAMSAHALAIAALWLATLSEIWQIGGTVMLGGSAIYYFYQLHRDAVSAIEADDSGYRLLNRGSWVTAQLEHALVTATLTVIEFKQENGQRVSLVLLPDSVAADDYRRLRVWLRWVKPIVA